MLQMRLAPSLRELPLFRCLSRLLVSSVSCKRKTKLDSSSSSQSHLLGPHTQTEAAPYSFIDWTRCRCHPFSRGVFKPPPRLRQATPLLHHPNLLTFGSDTILVATCHPSRGKHSTNTRQNEASLFSLSSLSSPLSLFPLYIRLCLVSIIIPTPLACSNVTSSKEEAEYIHLSRRLPIVGIHLHTIPLLISDLIP